MTSTTEFHFEKGSHATIYNNTRISVKGDCYVDGIKREAAKAATELPPMKQEITITGTNWNDIIKLPCFAELSHWGDEYELKVMPCFVDGRRADTDADWYGEHVYPGDTLIEYADGRWEVKHKDQ